MKSSVDLMTLEVRLEYKRGLGAKRLATNPFNQTSQLGRFSAWSAGHYDKWGRV